MKTSYLFQLAGNSHKTLYIAVIFSILSGLMVFVPYVMVFRTILFLFEGSGDIPQAVWYGAAAAAAIVLRFVF